MCPPSRSSLAAVLVALAALCPRSARAEAPPPARAPTPAKPREPAGKRVRERPEMLDL